MSGPLSPEEQKNIILSRMEEKRRNYQENFIQQFPAVENSTALVIRPEGFPRSHIFRLLTQSPYLIGIALAAVVVIASRQTPRKFVAGKLACIPGMLAGKARMLIVPAIIRMFRSYFSR